MLTTASGVPEVVLQRRSHGKDTWPGRLDVAVGGHVRAGETLAETLRECEEEIGLIVEQESLVRLGRRSVASHGGDADDREHQDVFAVVVAQGLTELVLHPREVDAVVRLGLDEATTLLVDRAAVGAVERRRDELEERPVSIDADDVVPGADGYYAAALEGLRRLAAGLRPEPFALREDVTR